MLVAPPENLEEFILAAGIAGDGKVYLIDGEPASKANSRRIFIRGGRPISIKSQKAMSFKELARCAKLLYGSEKPYECDVVVFAHLFYRSRRPDVDPSLVYDGLEGRGFVNDRQIRRQVTVGSIDKLRPRATIFVKPL